MKKKRPILDPAKRYFRYQEDRQPVIERTPGQKKIFDEYFVIENEAYGKMPLLIAGLILLVVGIILALAGMKTIALIISGCVAAVVGIVLLNLYRKHKTYKPKMVMTDMEFETLVKKKVEELNVPKLGMERLGLDPDEVREIAPITLRDKAITDTSLTVYDSIEGVIHSSTQWVAVLYFTDHQLLTYKLQFDMCCNKRDEWTSEFFYNDICDFSTKSERNILALGKDDKNKIEYGTTAVDIISTNSQIGFVFDSNNPAAASVHAMKQKIKERKQA